ncbi:DUF4157 domain-containing protein [Roseomonas sp. NAR14]|uniref:DUF4157 domain-containing protein n=1 Tax=Roseomonas acroporae TaxID=2937791 RepID=A0A9X1Y8R2_9PROT|nr:DUF4157 domain-containing protein [Roseomonas acroporae]MCK8786214.1 DUF4157 domain-containing protein [Roseomonas acroporae]
MGPSQALPSALRRRLEEAFRRPLGAVRVRTDAAASRLARALGARACVVGRTILFAEPRDLLSRTPDLGLVAHEVAHLLQPRRRPAPGAGAVPGAGPDWLEAPDGDAEREAEAAARQVLLGRRVAALRQPRAAIARTTASDALKPLIGHGIHMSAAETRKAASILAADPTFSATIAELEAAGKLGALLNTGSDFEALVTLVETLGGRSDAAAALLIKRRMMFSIGGDVPGGSMHDLIYGGDFRYLYDICFELQSSLRTLALAIVAAPFNPAGFASLVGGDNAGAFTGSGATGINPTKREVSTWDGLVMFNEKKNPFSFNKSTSIQYSNPVSEGPTYNGDLFAYLKATGTVDREKQAELLVRRPISSIVADSYARLPSRADVMRAAARAHNLHPGIIAAIILAEQRDQSANEDAKDLEAATSVTQTETSIGLGQIVPMTARRNDLFADLLPSGLRKSLTHTKTAYLLASDEFNIFACARYIRIVADMGKLMDPARLPKTLAAFPGLDLPRYALVSDQWPGDNVGALGMYYTSRPWTDDVRSQGWGKFVQAAYQDVRRGAGF